MIGEKMHKELNEYDDIINLPHHVSKKRPQMPLGDRAAQFSPFSAVVGHETAVREAARITDRKKELDEMERAIIDNQLREIEAQLPNEFDVEVTYFQLDELKAGGEYNVKVGRVKKVDKYTREVIMIDGTSIKIDDIFSIVNDHRQSNK